MLYRSAAKWYVTKERAYQTPSYGRGISIEKESFYRQTCASLIQDIGQHLRMYLPSDDNCFNQIAINTAILYMHRFYCYQSFQDFHRNDMAVACLLLASKVEEQVRSPIDIYIVYHRFIWREDRVKAVFHTRNHPEAERYNKKIACFEKALFMTLNSEVLVTHANEYVLICSVRNNYPSDVTQTAYFLATNSLHLTRFCIIYPPEFVACISLYLAGEWACYQLQTNDNENSPKWYECIAPNAHFLDIKSTALEFLEIMERCPSRIKQILRTGPIISNINDISMETKHTGSNAIEQFSKSVDAYELMESKNLGNDNKTTSITKVSTNKLSEYGNDDENNNNNDFTNTTISTTESCTTSVVNVDNDAASSSVCYRLHKAWDPVLLHNHETSENKLPTECPPSLYNEDGLKHLKRSRRSQSHDCSDTLHSNHRATQNLFEDISDENNSVKKPKFWAMSDDKKPDQHSQLISTNNSGYMVDLYDEQSKRSSVVVSATDSNAVNNITDQAIIESSNHNNNKDKIDDAINGDNPTPHKQIHKSINRKINQEGEEISKNVILNQSNTNTSTSTVKANEKKMQSEVPRQLSEGECEESSDDGDKNTNQLSH